jgi:cation-transporting ATPase E
MSGSTMHAKLTGLSSAEVAERVARGEVNHVPRSDFAEYRDIVWRNLFTLFNLLVVPAAIALFALRDYKAGVAVSGFALANTVLGLVQEIRGKWHLDRLALLVEARARVIRDGAIQEIHAGDIVKDEHLVLGAGDTVLADGTVLEARFLEVDEALLTGESDPVPRQAGDRLLSGSFCVAGEGIYRADRVGRESFAQKTTAEARAYRYTASPLQKSIDNLLRILTATAVVLCGSYLLLAQYRPIPETDLVEMIAATITSMVPQGLVLMVTLAFILGAVRMAARGAVVQRLNAVETMASIDVLCMDKTGTLTTNRLKLARVELLTDSVSDKQVRRRLRLFASNSLDQGSKTLGAIRDALGREKAELLDQLPFKSQNRCSAVRVRSGHEELVLVLGAPEALKPFLAPGTDGWEPRWRERIGTGLRLLLFAEAGNKGKHFKGSLEGLALRPLALVALSDELRPEAADVLRNLAGQGIQFKIISGDNPETVRATTAPLGASATEPPLKALAENPVVTGSELETAGNGMGELVRTRSVFGRVSPTQKVEIVAALKEQGRHVAMVGDGVNDVLPIKNANLGIAMGEGSRASKTVSGLVLETNDFQLLPQTLDEGRTILRNLRRAGKLFLVKNVYMLVLIVGCLCGLPFPFRPQQVTLLNFLIIGIPALVITASKERTRAGSRAGFIAEVGWFALRTGIVLGIAGLALILLAGRSWDADVDLQRTALLTGMVLMGVGTLLRALRDGEPERTSGDRLVHFLAIASVPLYCLALYLKPLASFFVLTPLTAEQWGQIAGVAAVATAAVLAWDWLRRPPGSKEGNAG